MSPLSPTGSGIISIDYTSDASHRDRSPVTPATTTSSKSSHSSPWSSDIRANKLSGEAIEFIDGLHDSNYIPLGCLTYEDFAQQPPIVTKTTRWETINQAPLLLGQPVLCSNLGKLFEAGWLRMQVGRSTDARFLIYRIFLLPGDAGHRFVDRQSLKLWAALQGIITEVDVSPSVWNGDAPGTELKFDMWATRGQGSLFYMFDKLPSPCPSASVIEEKYAHEALEDLLDPASILPGLKTVLYPYQRRSAGLMLQRESVAKLELDPRLEERRAPDGSTYYYGARDLLFLRQPRYYEACRGGILAETMGLGKTVMLLAMILATKNHLPKIPSAYAMPPVRPKVGSLSEMCISTVNRKSVPWKVEFERVKHASGDDMERCAQLLQQSPPTYYIPLEPQRWNRKTVLPPPKKMVLAPTTLIVVPRNLLRQWQSEIEKHVEDGALNVLVMEDLKRALPPPEELRTYDVVLFSRNRFEMEIRDGSDEQGRRILATQLVCRCPYIGATRNRDCHCVRTDDLYHSPLQHLHFKRLIIDEGHFFSNSNTTAVAVANKLVKADHCWVVSGTPAKDLLGVEVDMSAAENMWQTPETKDCRDAVLEQRKHYSTKEDTAGAIKSLGSLATNFLKIRPWCALDSGERKAEWDEYIYRHEDLRKRTYSGFSSSLQRTLEAMVVKTQPEDVERDIELPPLSHEVVRLEPSYYDKLTANLFTLVLTANAITSERTDADYLFHKNSAKARYQLVQNLRQSAFFWTGFSEADVAASLRNSKGYLAKENTNCTEEDRQLLTELLVCAETIQASAGWKALSRSHELGLFIEDWPEENAVHWAFDGESQAPLLTGVSQLLEAQKHVNERAGADDPGEGLAGAGIRALAPARYGTAVGNDGDKKAEKKPVLTKAGIPTSSLDGEPMLKRRYSTGSKAKASPKKQQTLAFKVTKAKKRGGLKRSKTSPATTQESACSTNTSAVEGQPKLSRKRRHSELDTIEFNPASPYLKGRIVGSTSAKLSYLISQIVKYHRDEKILVFYDGDNVAYYIAQMLELLHIKHEIYAKSLAASLKSEYVVRFDQEAQDRVLLMDVKQAAFGLNLSSASRIYFVNPVCRPNVEAQAIKRAHRIGQTRKVYVETLVLKGTIEEKMLERAKRMTRSEHNDAKALEDDGGIRQIIQSARLLPVDDGEQTGYGQMAPIEVPQQLWGREGWKETISSSTLMTAKPPVADKRRKTITFEDITNEDGEAKLVNEDEDVKPRMKRRRLAFVNITNPDLPDQELVEGSDDEPMVERWRRTSSFGSQSSTTGLLPKGMKGNAMMAFMPCMATERMAPIFSPVESQSPIRQLSPPLPTSHLTEQQHSHRLLSIANLLNDDHDQIPTAGQRTELVGEIVRRL